MFWCDLHITNSKKYINLLVLVKDNSWDIKVKVEKNTHFYITGINNLPCISKKHAGIPGFAAIFITIVILWFEMESSRIIWSQCMCGCVLMLSSTDLRWVYLCWPAGHWVKNEMSWGNTQTYTHNKSSYFFILERIFETLLKTYYRCTDSFLTSLRALCPSQLDSLAQPGCVKRVSRSRQPTGFMSSVWLWARTHKQASGKITGYKAHRAHSWCVSE